MFSRLRKPKWEDKDPAIRERSIDALDPSSTKDQGVLARLAQSDSALNVRLAALAKLQSFSLAKAIFDNAEHPEEKALALERIKFLFVHVSSKQDRSEFLNFLASSVLTPAERLDIAIKTVDPEIGVKITADISDEDTLVQVALSSKTVRTRMYAAEKLNSQNSLKVLQKKSDDKAVLHYVREKLKAVKAQESELQLQQEDLERICQTLEKLAEKDSDKHLESRLDALLLQWNDYDQAIKSDYLSRFDKALLKCRSRIESVKAEQDRYGKIQAATEAHKHLCEQLKIVQDELEKDPAVFEPARFSQFLEDKRLSWKHASEVRQPDSNIAARYYKTMDALLVYQDARVRLAQCVDPIAQWLEMDLSEKVTDADIRSCQRELLAAKKAIKWPETFAKPKTLQILEIRLELLQKKLKRWEEENQSRSRFIGKKLAVLQKEINKRNLIAANKLYHFISKQIAELEEPFRRQEEMRLEKIKRMLDELRDWCEFVTLPKKQALCEQMDALVNRELPVVERAHQIKRLQEEWKKLSTSNTDSDQSLWGRFKEAADQAYKPCLAYYETKDKVRAENLKKRLEICDQLAHFLEITDWGAVDWRQIERIEKKAREEWALYKTVPLNENEAIQARFDQLVGEIRGHLDTERDANLDERIRLIRRAEELLAHDDIEDAASDAQKLQEKWKIVGFTYRSQDHKQWKLFKETCDAIFRKRDAARVERQQKTATIVENAQSLIRQLGELSKLPDHLLTESQQQYSQLKKNFTDLLEGLPVKQLKQIEKSFDKVERDYRNQLKGIDLRERQRHLQTIAAAAAICVQLENAAFKDEIPDLDALRSMFRESIEDSPADLKADMEQRFNLALQAMGSDDRGIWKESPELLQRQQQLEQLAIELEILAGIESPEPYRAARMAFQLERLQSGMQIKSQDPMRHADINEFLLRWFRVGAVDPDSRNELEFRLNKVLKTVLSNGSLPER